MKKFDFSPKMANDIILIDKETFNDIKLDAQGLIENFKSNDMYSLFIKYIDNIPVGFIGLMKATTPHYSGWWVDLLAVRPEYQGKSIGGEMVSFAKKEYKKDNEVMTALIRGNNISSIKSVEKNGFISEETEFKLFILS